MVIGQDLRYPVHWIDKYFFSAPPPFFLFLPDPEEEEAELVARLRAVFGRYGSSCYTKHEAYQG